MSEFGDQQTSFPSSGQCRTAANTQWERQIETDWNIFLDTQVVVNGSSANVAMDVQWTPLSKFWRWILELVRMQCHDGWLHKSRMCWNLCVSKWGKRVFNWSTTNGTLYIDFYAISLLIFVWWIFPAEFFSSTIFLLFSEAQWILSISSICDMVTLSATVLDDDASSATKIMAYEMRRLRLCK